MEGAAEMSNVECEMSNVEGEPAADEPGLIPTLNIHHSPSDILK